MSLAAHAANAMVIFQENFEDARAYTMSNGFFTTLPHSPLTLGYSISNIDGSSYFGARNLDGFTSATPHRVTFNTQDVSAYKNLSLVVALSALSGNRFEGNDAITLDTVSAAGSH